MELVLIADRLLVSSEYWYTRCTNGRFCAAILLVFDKLIEI